MRRLSRNTFSFFNSIRTFSNEAFPPTVQFMHVLQKEGQKGRFENFTNYHPTVNPYEFPVDVRKHKKSHSAIMEQQAKDAFKGMVQLLNQAIANHGAYQISKGLPIVNGNSVTFVATPEFFFYPAFAPFSYEIFQKHILEPLKQHVKTLPNWLIFHLETIPVQMTKGLLNDQTISSNSFINAALYGKAGANGAVFLYSKKHHKLPEIGLSTSGEGIPFTYPGDPHTESLNPATLNLPNIAIFETEIGQEFMVVLEICLDHDEQRGIKYYKSFIKEQISQGKSAPKHGLHQVISDSVPLMVKHSTFTILSQVDPRQSVAGKIISKQNLMPDIKGIIQERRWKFSESYILDRAECITIPCNEATQWVPFEIKCYEPMSLGQISAHVKGAMEEEELQSSSDLNPKP